MRIAAKSVRRRGAVVIEAAFVLPIVFTLLIAIVLGAMLVFAYQEVATLAREGSRYASVHGKDHEMITREPAATPADIYNNAIKPRVMTLNTANMSYQVTWQNSNRPGNTVTVEVSYPYSSLIFGNLQLRSRSTMTITH